jgi:hypothetical protein
MSFDWDHPKELAAELLAEGELEQKEIAAQCGVTYQTLWNWRKIPDFQARVEQRLREIRAEIRRHGIAVVERRVARVHDTWKRLQRVVQARAADMAGIPGGDTGLLVRKTKMLGTGVFAREIEEYEVDTGLLAELRAHEKQAAEELGQWLTKTESQVKAEVIIDTDDDEIDGWARQRARAIRQKEERGEAQPSGLRGTDEQGEVGMGSTPGPPE